MEQLYADFTSKVLPALQEGLIITKEYFIDLFGRYIKYLIVIDSIGFGVSVFVVIIGMIMFARKKKWAFELLDKTTQEYRSGNPGGIFLLVLFITISVIATISSFAYINNLAKDIYVPEIRVYEQLKEFNSPRI